MHVLPFKIGVPDIWSSSIQIPAMIPQQDAAVFPSQTFAYTAMPVGASFGGPGSHLPYTSTAPTVQGHGQSPPVAPPVAPPVVGALTPETSQC